MEETEDWELDDDDDDDDGGERANGVGRNTSDRPRRPGRGRSDGRAVRTNQASERADSALGTWDAAMVWTEPWRRTATMGAFHSAGCGAGDSCHPRGWGTGFGKGTCACERGCSGGRFSAAAGFGLEGYGGGNAGEPEIIEERHRGGEALGVLRLNRPVL